LRPAPQGIRHRRVAALGDAVVYVLRVDRPQRSITSRLSRLKRGNSMTAGIISVGHGGAQDMFEPRVAFL